MTKEIDLGDGDWIVFRPPSDKQRLRNEANPRAARILPEFFKELFQRWPNLN